MPPIINLGGLLIKTPYLALLAFGTLLAWLTSRIERRQLGSENVLADHVSRMFLVGIAGARVAYVAEHFEAYRQHLLSALYFWLPGHSASGGFLFATAYLGWAVWRRRLSLSEVRLISVTGIPLSAVYLVSLATIGQFASAGQLRIGGHLPAFEFTAIDGRQENLAALRGRPAVVNIWATWCAPCREEMPLLSRTYAEGGKKEFALVGIDLAEPKQRIESFLKQRSVSYPIWSNPGAATTKQVQSPSTALFAHTGGFAVPTTIFVNRRGIIGSIYIGKLTAAIFTINLQKITG